MSSSSQGKVKAVAPLLKDEWNEKNANIFITGNEEILAEFKHKEYNKVPENSEFVQTHVRDLTLAC